MKHLGKHNKDYTQLFIRATNQYLAFFYTYNSLMNLGLITPVYRENNGL